MNQAWKEDSKKHFFEPPDGATDSFRYGMALNPHMRAFITHGRFDMVTPYYATDRLRNLMRLDPETAARLTVRHFDGGHMFYAWEESRHAFTAAIAKFFEGAGWRRGSTGRRPVGRPRVRPRPGGVPSERLAG